DGIRDLIVTGVQTCALPISLGRNTRGVVNGLIGGWQIAGNGQLVSRYFALPTSNWGPIGNVEVYGKKYPIQDCRSGVCYNGYLRSEERRVGKEWRARRPAQQ